MLTGMSDRTTAQVVALARSWVSPPKFTVSGVGYAGRGYDPSQRAYIVEHNAAGDPGTLQCMLQASAESPIVNVPLVVKNWGEAGTHCFSLTERRFRGERASVSGTSPVWRELI